MGTEAKGTLTVGGQKVPVKGDFGSDRVLLSGGRRGMVSYKDVEVLGTAKGRLRVRIDDAVMEFELGSSVDRIANKIRKPPGRLDKMGVKPGLSAAVVEGDDAFIAELRRVLPKTLEGKPPEPVDLLVLGIETAEDLDGLAPHVRFVKDDGSFWVVYPKGSRDLTQLQVLEAGRRARLKDVKVMRFSESHSAIKFVIPFAET